MSLPVAVAVTDGPTEQRLVAAFGRPGATVCVVRRCVEVADLLAVAGSGSVRAVLVSGDLRRFDGAAVAHLRAAGVAVVALAADEARERVLRGLGVEAVLPLTADPELVCAALFDAVRTAAGERAVTDGAVADAPAALGADGSPGDPAGDGGQVIAVWGPPGAPGRTLVATTLAAEFALRDWPTLLVDSDVYAASVAQVTGIVDEVPGLAVAAREASLGILDVPRLAGHARAVRLGTGTRRSAPGGSMRVLTGLPRADRWPELRPEAVERVLELSRLLCRVTLVDCSASLETDERATYDLPAPQRNGATLAALGVADHVVAVGAADPVGLARLVRSLGELSDVLPQVRPRVVINRLRPGPVPGDARAEIRAALTRFAGVTPVAFLPEDRAATDAGLAVGRLLAEVAPASALRVAIAGLVTELGAVPEAKAPGRIRRIERPIRLRPRRKAAVRS